MTIKDILQKVDLMNVSSQNVGVRQKSETETTSVITVSNPTKLKLGKSVIQQSNPTSAYLGPKLWDNSITISNLGLEDEEEEEEEEAGPYSEVMNMEDFLAENNIKMDMMESSPEPIQTIEVPVYSSQVYSPSSLLDSPQASPPSYDIKPPQQQRPSIIMGPKQNPNSDAPLFEIIFSDLKIEPKKEILPKGENTFLYAESKRAKLEREKEERRRKLEVDLDFAPEDLALATVPGMDFDPKERAFDMDELRPQPIIKKRQKVFVPDLSKDDKYWDKRDKNNVAARRSREARRLKENQIALRAAYLEKENKVLKKELDGSNFDNTKLATERDILKRKLSQFESFALHK